VRVVTTGRRDPEVPPLLAVELEWTGGLEFQAYGKARAGILVDGDSVRGPSPMETLLSALASCAASDIVDILRKGRQELRALVIRLTGERRAEIPRRFTRIRAHVRIAGTVERAKAERAVHLAFDKYCSVRASLDPAIPVEIDLEVEA
jgi:putative redox protein